MIVDLKDYLIAAILLDVAQKEYSGFARVYDPEEFRDEFERVYSVEVPIPLLNASVQKLVELGGGTIVSDPFTRDYIYMDARQCEALFRDAEDNPDTVIGRAYLIGTRYIEEALLRIMALAEENLLAEFYDFEEPDRFAEIDRTEEAVQKIDAEFEKLELELASNNESAIALGDTLDVAKAEVKDLKTRWSNTKVRAAAFVNQAQQTLVWIAKKAGNTVVGETAKRLYDLIVDFFF